MIGMQTSISNPVNLFSNPDFYGEKDELMDVRSYLTNTELAWRYSPLNIELI